MAKVLYENGEDGYEVRKALSIDVDRKSIIPWRPPVQDPDNSDVSPAAV